MEWTDLKTYMGVDSDDHDDLIESAWDDALVMLELATARAFRPVPQNIMDRMTLEVGNELYNRRSAPSGNSQFVAFEGGSIPVRGPRDPLTQVRPILAMYVVPF